jgi:hypothetical protein
VKKLALIVPIAALFFVAAPAAAEYEASENETGDQEVTFTDDDLLADTIDTLGLTFTIRLPPARTLLIRPRASFVPELGQSVEDI